MLVIHQKATAISALKGQQGKFWNVVFGGQHYFEMDTNSVRLATNAKNSVQITTSNHKRSRDSFLQQKIGGTNEKIWSDSQ
ncbi:hypothetical protein PIB30_088098, partial [Stylosanthes scabra]|nr:hypothetical protein [Stylosanthes scabra]